MNVKVIQQTRNCMFCRDGKVDAHLPAGASCDACQREAIDCGCIAGIDCSEHGVIPALEGAA